MPPKVQGFVLIKYGLLVGKPEGRRRQEDVVVDGPIILQWIFKK
jgi:hypothetical protein